MKFRSLPSSLYLYLATGMIAASTLMLEVLLTRIFSVTMSYHFAFLVISLAIFGISTGALLVHIYKKNHVLLGTLSLAYTFSILITGTVVYVFQFDPIKTTYNLSILTLNIVASLLPFIVSGVIISIIMTEYNKKIESLYASDLAGAALGCVGIFVTINMLGIIHSLFLIALLGTLSAYLFFNHEKKRFGKIIAVGAASIIGLLLVLPYVLPGVNLIPRLNSLKGDNSSDIMYEKWNTYSRVTVRKEKKCCETERLGLRIDADAYTPIYRFDGDLERFEFLKSDIANIAHHIRPHSRILIVGSGGGKDILSGLVFEQPAITAVEINSTITKLLTDTFKEYTGNIAHFNGVRLMNAEARSFVAGSNNTYDIIQISLIDTWAASSAGAYSLTENGLYTVQAYCNYLRTLSDDGIVSTTRWYAKNSPYEVLRLFVLTQESLKQCKGIANPENNIILLNQVIDKDLAIGNATLLFSPTSFSDADLSKANSIARNYNLEKLYIPKGEQNNNIRELLKVGEAKLSKRMNINLSAPTDESPYFFQMIKPYQIYKILSTNHGINSKNTSSVLTLLATFIILLIFSTALVLFPFWKIVTNNQHRGRINYFVLYFICIGFGYMLIEISVMQRLSLLLGHPSLGLTLVLSTLLISSGIGSLYSSKIHQKISILKLVSIVLVAVSFISPYLIQLSAGQNMLIRSVTSIIILSPIGVVMGCCLPLGMNTLTKNKKGEISAWLWSINGAASVLGSSLALIISMSHSISMAYVAGVICYAGAYYAYYRITRS